MGREHPLIGDRFGLVVGAMLKLALEQGLALLCGLAVVTIVQPTATGGMLLLIVVTMAAFNAIRILYSSLRQWWTTPSVPAPLINTPKANRKSRSLRS